MSKRMMFGDMTSLIRLVLVFGIAFTLTAVVFHNALGSIANTSIHNMEYLYNF